jgi:hypothetical protein
MDYRDNFRYDSSLNIRELIICILWTFSFVTFMNVSPCVKSLPHYLNPFCNQLTAALLKNDEATWYTIRLRSIMCK